MKIFINGIYSNPPRKNYPKNRMINKHIDEFRCIDLLDLKPPKTQGIGIFSQ